MPGGGVRTSWPRVECRISRTFDADHSLPQMGQPERHRHSYWVGFGYTQEINPATGSAKCSVAKLLQDADACVALVREKYLKGAMTGIRSPARWAAGWCLASTLIARRSGETELDARAKTAPDHASAPPAARDSPTEPALRARSSRPPQRPSVERLRSRNAGVAPRRGRSSSRFPRRRR
jgi:hypothetical protein